MKKFQPQNLRSSGLLTLSLSQRTHSPTVARATGLRPWAFALGAAALCWGLTLAPAPAFAQASGSKKELVARILKLQQPGIEAMARSMVEQPASQMLGEAGNALASLPADKQEALAKALRGDAQKYVDDTFPLVRDSAVKLAPATVGALLDQKLSEPELKQLVTLLESPAYAKYTQMVSEMQAALQEKLVGDTRAAVEPKLKALEDSLRKRLTAEAGAAGAAGGKAAPAAPAAAPAK